MSDAFTSGTTTVTGHHGDVIEAYAATPVAPTGAGGMVVIHHMPGFDEATKEIVRRLASWGYAAVCPNLHHRDAPGAAPDDASAANRANGGVSDDRLVGDVAGAVEHLRAVPGGNGRVGVIGFCSGGRQSVLAACSLDLDAAVDCYGAFVLAAPPPDRAGLAVTSLRPMLGDLSCPLLGLFGVEDRNPAPAEVAELDTLLIEAGKEHTFRSFDDAGHGFFAVSRPSYRVAAATDGWQVVQDFLAQHLGTATRWGR
jgi:carboxymethylenebutenolidase